MRIPVVYATDSVGCAPTYTIKALERMGHETKWMTPGEYFASDPSSVDLYWCQDSGEGINFWKASHDHLRKTSMWYWDSRFNRVQRDPGDDDMAQLVSADGGWVFQAEMPDVERLSRERRLVRQSWLPIAGDPRVWSNEPEEEKIHGISFVGNCYDSGRGAALNFARDYCGLYWPGPNALFFEDAARIYRQSRAVFHAPTFYNLPHDVTGERIDYDVTMRYYEALSCGVSVITPPMPDFGALGFVEGEHIFQYSALEQIPDAVGRALEKTRSDPGLGLRLRQFILDRHTYEHRIATALERLKLAGVLNAQPRSLG